MARQPGKTATATARTAANTGEHIPLREKPKRLLDLQVLLTTSYGLWARRRDPAPDAPRCGRWRWTGGGRGEELTGGFERKEVGRVSRVEHCKFEGECEIQ
jgi:hypothetical protein